MSVWIGWSCSLPLRLAVGGRLEPHTIGRSTAAGHEQEHGSEVRDFQDEFARIHLGEEAEERGELRSDHDLGNQGAKDGTRVSAKYRCRRETAAIPLHRAISQVFISNGFFICQGGVSG
ncbi:hypothetical protein BJX63DRAFT_188174 [Aspergillus granulosus]|uniref:Secreted protein n=1 Tax=Aspergillus granulosus TaxID=176169 RepID=A0ABR4HHR6_9EURO